jgi:hypothetical protein
MSSHGPSQESIMKCRWTTLRVRLALLGEEPPRADEPAHGLVRIRAKHWNAVQTLSEVSAQLIFLEDGLHVIVTIEKK